MKNTKPKKGPTNNALKEIWKPSGVVHTKPKVNSLSSTDGTSSNTSHKTVNKTQTHFLEFDYMEQNDIIITIEHCSKCNEHSTHFNHNNNIYLNFAKILQRIILVKYPFIKVFLKPIDDTTLRIGALEVQIAWKPAENEETKIIPLHSKLSSGNWPNIKTLLPKIAEQMPSLNLHFTVYDYEDSSVAPQDEWLPSKWLGVKVNLYQLNIIQIKYYSAEAYGWLDSVYNYNRKNGNLSTMTTFGNLNPISETFILNNNNNNSSFFNPRPITTRTNKFNATTFASHRNSFSSGRQHQSNTNSNVNCSFFNTSRPWSSSSSRYSSYNNMTGYYNRKEGIDDLDIINQWKGKWVASGYTDNEGVIIFKNLTYDAYLIEAEQNKNYLTSAIVVRFDKIVSEDSVGKIVRLKRQINSYLEVFVYEENNWDMEWITGATVSVVKSDIGVENKYLLSEESNSWGIYQGIISPGYLDIYVFKEGYLEGRKWNVEVKCGENKINIEWKKD